MNTLLTKIIARLEQLQEEVPRKTKELVDAAVDDVKKLVAQEGG
jgi:hypothetical protein